MNPNPKYTLICNDPTCEYAFKSNKVDETCPRCEGIEFKVLVNDVDESPFLDAT